MSDFLCPECGVFQMFSSLGIVCIKLSFEDDVADLLKYLGTSTITR